MHADQPVPTSESAVGRDASLTPPFFYFVKVGGDISSIHALFLFLALRSYFNRACTSFKNPSIRENANHRLPRSFNEAPK